MISNRERNSHELPTSVANPFCPVTFPLLVWLRFFETEGKTQLIAHVYVLYVHAGAALCLLCSSQTDDSNDYPEKG